MGVTKARAERNKMKEIEAIALSLPAHDVSSHPFWVKLRKPKKIAAPMVRHTDLPCRMQLRKHGAELCYTSMIDSDKFVLAAPASRSKFFETNAADRPLIVQFGATNAEDFVSAGLIVEGEVDAVCLNMDCPQRRALAQGFGAFLMRDNEQEVFKIIRRASTELKVPVCAKIRLLSLPPTVGNGFKSVPLVSQTVEFCKKLEESGCSLIAIHARTIDMSSGSSARDNDNHVSTYRADYEAINSIRKHLTIPVVANGDIQSMRGLSECLERSGADGAMVATELMYNPRLFSMPSTSNRHVFSPTSQLAFAAEYHSMCSLYGGYTAETLRSHLVDSVIVPCLSPESCRAMIPFGEGVEVLEDAERRLLEIAVFLSVICGGEDKRIYLRDVEIHVNLMERLAEAKDCLRWCWARGGVGAGAGQGLDEKVAIVTEAFQRGNELMRLFRLGGGKKPERMLGEGGGCGGGATKKKKKKKTTKRKADIADEEVAKVEKRRKVVMKLARKVLKKASGRRMKLKSLAVAVAGNLEEGEGATAKDVKRLLKRALTESQDQDNETKSKRLAVEGKEVVYKK
ncbi:hypothetical protein TrST_g188 [Triparma strigata]|uniref:DUS-like FMN-binding domain-containing protein n=1 Tax=Triparma strigata TaxID=1606541 RepID=A0A9W7AC67_9STRA|nr:hypothetical protein TrST_g188 [Triparma strigata]